MSPVMMHVVGVGITWEIQYATAPMRLEIIVPLAANRREGALQPEAIAVLTRVAVSDKFVHETNHGWMIDQAFEWPADR